MGIQGLHSFISGAISEAHLSTLKGQRCAVDGYAWLHGALRADALKLATGQPSHECCSAIFGKMKEGVKCIETAHRAVLEQALAVPGVARGAGWRQVVAAEEESLGRAAAHEGRPHAARERRHLGSHAVRVALQSSYRRSYKT